MYISAIGVKLNPNFLFETVKVKKFDHSYSEEWKYDPISGNVLWEEKLIKKSIIKNLKSDLNDVADVFGFWGDFPIINNIQNNYEDGILTEYYLLFDYIIFESSKDEIRSENIFSFKKVNLEKILLYIKDYKIPGEVQLILIQCI